MILFSYADNDMTLHHTVTEAPDDAMFPLHAHDMYEVYCFLCGQGYYTVEGHDYPLSPGSILIMRDGETHKLHISSGRTYERVALHFSPALLPSDAAEYLLEPFRKRTLGQENMLPASPAADRVRDMLLRICAEDTPLQDRRCMAHAYLPAILFEITRAVSESGIPEPSVEGSAPHTVSGSLPGEIIEFINRDPAAVSGVEVLEQRFGYSRSYLNRTFRQSTGVSIWEYVILKRLTQARAAIRSGCTATVAARNVGYTDYSSFYRQYRKRFGCTPEEEKHGGAG